MSTISKPNPMTQADRAALDIDKTNILRDAPRIMAEAFRKGWARTVPPPTLPARPVKGPAVRVEKDENEEVSP